VSAAVRLLGIGLLQPLGWAARGDGLSSSLSSPSPGGVPGCPRDRVRTFCTVSRRPSGPLAPPPRHARLRSRWRSRYGGANAGRLARRAGDFRAAVDRREFQRLSCGCPCSRCGILQGRTEPVKAVCERRTTAPVEPRGQRTREDGLDRTSPAKETAAIGSMDGSGQAGLTLKRQFLVS
jgi:hypothetical protein